MIATVQQLPGRAVALVTGSDSPRRAFKGQRAPARRASPLDHALALAVGVVLLVLIALAGTVLVVAGSVLLFI